MKDIESKLQSLKTLRSEMKDWKKDDLRKKKGVKDPEPKEQEKKQTDAINELMSKLLKE